jgi:hypothetical protein
MFKRAAIQAKGMVVLERNSRANASASSFELIPSRRAIFKRLAQAQPYEP